MVISQKDAVQAYLAVKKLNEQDTSIKTAKKVFDLFTKLRKAWDFQVQEELKLYERYPEIDPISHGIKFKSVPEREKALEIINKFNADADEIGNVEFEIEFEPFTINSDNEAGIKLSGSDISKLSAFISFE